MNSISKSWLYRNDPARFARDILGFQPDANQTAMLSVETHRAILACHRQWGKTTTAAIKAIHHALFHPDSLSVVVAPALRQSGHILAAISRFARKLRLALTTDPFNRPSLVFPNQARIVAVPSNEDTILGFSAVSLLLIDEAARVTDEIWAAVLPMVSTVDGAVWLMSTPRGKLGFFADMWFSDDPAWHRVSATADKNSRIPQSVLAEHRRALSRTKFAQNYLCEFGEIENQVFSAEHIGAAFTAAFAPLPPGRDKTAGTANAHTWDLSYFVGLDLGQRHDYSALTVIEVHSWYNGLRNPADFNLLSDHTLRVRGLRRFPLGTAYPDVMRHVTELIEQLGQRSTLVVDATGLGAPFVDFLKRSDFRLRSDFPGRPPQPVPAGPNHLAPRGYLLPVVITGGTKAHSGERGTWNVPKVDLIETLIRMFESGRLQICETLEEARALKNELLGLRRDGNTFGPYSERVHDDLLMSLALASWRVTRHRKDFLWQEEPRA